MSILKINNLYVKSGDKEIIKGINLVLEKGNIYVLMGPNGSGKSTLLNAIMGSPKYEISEGKIFYKSKDISKLKAHERAKKGIFLAFQNPVEVSGVTIHDFLRSALKSLGKKEGRLDYILKEKAKKLGINKELITRYLNENFSGGEKKKLEILQMLVLDPELAMLDETDSGVDADSIKSLSHGINKFMNSKKCILIITHYEKILDYIKPKKIFILKNGKIVREGASKKILDEIRKKGYSKI